MPVKARKALSGLPAYNTVHNILTNPIYAGVYAFGRTTSKVTVEDGRKRVPRGVRRPLAECDVLLKDHHESYITWDESERNQRVIAHNAMSKGSAMVPRSRQSMLRRVIPPIQRSDSRGIPAAIGS